MEIKKILKMGIGAFVTLFALIIIAQSWYTVNEGEMAVYQNPLPFGGVEASTSLGTHFSMPLFGHVTSYQKEATVVFGNADKGEASFYGNPVKVSFQDGYDAYISATARFKLPTKADDLVRLNSGFQNYESVVENLLAKGVKEALVAAGLTYTSEGFYLQAGATKYRGDVNDYVQNSLPVFVQIQKEMKRAAIKEHGAAVVEGKKTKQQKQFIEVYAPKIVDGVIVRTKNTLKLYGIELIDVVVTGSEPSKELDKRLDNLRQVFDQRKIDRAGQENAVQAKITAQLEGETATEKATQAEKLVKEVAVVKAEQQVEVAKQEKEKAVVEKSKELEIAEANKSIQIANAEAALAEAKAIRAIGLAKADAEKALWKARDNQVYAADLKRKMMIEVSRNLKDTTITMPQIMMGGGGSNATSTGTAIELLNIMAAGSIKDQLATAK
jgi:hypothetical protein